MNDRPPHAPIPHLPCYTVVSPSGLVGTVEIGSMADYLERMEKWKLGEMEHVTDAAERADAEKALQSVRRERQQLVERENGKGTSLGKSS